MAPTTNPTQALNLWLNSDQRLREETRERVADAIAHDADGTHQENGQPWSLHDQRVAGEAVKDFVDEVTDPDESLMTPEQIVKLVAGVNWDEIGQAWLNDSEA